MRLHQNKCCRTLMALPALLLALLLCACGAAPRTPDGPGLTLPVIGIPVKSGPFEGLDALLSTVQMTSGIPVATVAVNGAKNAAILAVEILSVTDGELAEKLDENRREGAANVLKKNEEIGSKYRS